MSARVISWRTHRGATGYEWTVFAVAYQSPTEILKTGLASSRDIATRQAKRWTRYLKQQAKQEKGGTNEVERSG